VATYGYVQKFGRTPDIDAGDLTDDIWDGTGSYTFPAAAAAMKISSSSTDDDSGGTGALTARVIGLNASWQEVEQDVTLDGQTGVTIPVSLIRVYRAYVLTVGTGGVNAGDIWIGTGDITNGVPAVKYAGILTGHGQTLMAIYTVPDNCTGATIWSWYGTISSVASARATIALQTRELGGAWRTRDARGIAAGSSGVPWPIYNGVTVGTKCDIRIRALSVGVNNSTLEAGFDLELTDEN
jgi:hypothetical protein